MRGKYRLYTIIPARVYAGRPTSWAILNNAIMRPLAVDGRVATWPTRKAAQAAINSVGGAWQ